MDVMQGPPLIFNVLLAAMVLTSGCTRPVSNSTAEKEAAENPVVWLERDLAVEGMMISVGHRGRAAAGHTLEPTVAITKDDKPVAGAMVFCQLVSPDGRETLGEEVATVFEPASGGRPACYAEGKLLLPEDARSIAVRVRIVLPVIDKEWSKDFTILQ